MGLHFLAGYVLGEHGRQSARLASQAGAGSGPTIEELFDVEERIDRLILIVAAMWSLLEEQGMTEEQLQQRIGEMDESDGVTDGKMTPLPTVCRQCGAKVSAGLTACQFCGNEVDTAAQPGPFDAV
jgi:hypothetical protein